MQTSLDTRGAKVHCIKIQKIPNLAHKCAHRCLAVGACYSRHNLWLRTKIKRRRKGQSAARIVCDNDGSIGIGKPIRCDFGTNHISEDRARVHTQSVLNELTTMFFGAWQGRKQEACLHFTAIHRNTCNGGITPLRRGQTELLQSH